MKKVLTTLTLLLTLCPFVFGQEDNYFGDPISDYQFNMTINSIVYVNGELQTNQNIEIAAYIDGELRAVCRRYDVYSNFPAPFNTYHYRTIMPIGGYSDNGKEIIFKGYNHDTKEELISVSEEFLFEIDKAILFSNPFAIKFETSSIAQIGDEKYETLAAAYEAAQDGETITLIKDATGAGLVINKDITIDLNEKTYTFNEGVGNVPSNGFQILKDNNVTIKNGTLNVATEASNKFYILVQNYANLTIDNATLDGTNLDKWSTVENNWDSYTLSNNSGNVNISNTTIIANNDGIKSFAFDACKSSYYTAPIVTLGENVTIEGNVELNGGQLYHNITGINATVKKTFTPQTEQFYWNTISAPIVGGAAIPTNATHDLYRYDEAEQEWEYYLDADGVGFSTLELGRGYLYTAGNEAITVELNGELNVANVEFPLSYTEGNELAGFNMIGNPFTHNINETHFSGATLSEGYYVIGENGEWLSRYDGADDIEPMQSVLVKTSEEANVTIKKQAADTRNVSNGSLRIDVTGSNCQDVAYVSFNEGIGLDKISHNNSTSALLYITNEGKDYAVATMSKDVTEIPVAFKAMTMGEYTISVTAQNCEFETLYLTDRLTGEKVNLNMESYSFVATSNDNPNRFVLTTTETLGIEDNKAEAFVYINNDEIIINNIQGHAQLNIIDMMGRQVASYDVFESAVISTSSLERGVYLIQMTDANGIRTQKILVD